MQSCNVKTIFHKWRTLLWLPIIVFCSYQCSSIWTLGTIHPQPNSSLFLLSFSSYPASSLPSTQISVRSQVFYSKPSTGRERKWKRSEEKVEASRLLEVWPARGLENRRWSVAAASLQFPLGNKALKFFSTGTWFLKNFLIKKTFLFCSGV